MALDVKVPSVGESVQEGMIHKWHKQTGDYVERDEVVVELETDKATVEIVAEAAGVVETLKKEGDTVNVGEVIAKIDTAAAKTGAAPKPAAKKEEAKPETAKVEPAKSAQSAPARQQSAPAASLQGGDAPLSPAVRRLISEHGLEASAIAASGKGGRLTKGDVLTYVEQDHSQAVTSAGGGATHLREVAPVGTQRSEGRGERRQPMSMMRRRIAERLVEAQQTAAILTTFNEIDMSAILELRKQYKESFKERHGVSLGFMGFFVSAAVQALKAYPAINGWVEGKDIVYHDYYDVGVAVSSDRGLVVPVVRDVDKMSLAEIELAIGAYAKKARDGKISIDDLTGGTFTISNGGVFGSLLSTPILNPPQSGILGMHKIEERPMVVNGQIVARPMMYVALSYDHRIVDGKEAVQFLVKIKECVEDPHRLLLGV